MQITALYEDKNNVLTTAQVHAEPDESAGSFDLEASIQFVSGPHAVEFDFTVFAFPDQADQGREKIMAELEAVNRLADQVAEFQAAFNKAAAVALGYLES